MTQDQVEALLAKARQEEKDKLYGRVDKLQEQLRELAADRETRLAAEQTAADQAAADAKKRAEADMDIRKLWEVKEAEFTAQLNTERQERLRAEAMRDKETALSKLLAYKDAKMREHEEDIIPDMRNLVQGESESEIDQSIARLVEISSNIINKAKETFGEARRAAPGVSTAGAPPSGAMEINSDNKQYSAEEISAMSVNEYAKHRAKLLGQARVTNRGLFG